jgi:hypothetical protein
MSSANDTNALISAIVYGKSLKPSQRPTTPNAGSAMGMSESRVQIPSGSQGSILFLLAEMSCLQAKYLGVYFHFHHSV